MTCSVRRAAPVLFVFATSLAGCSTGRPITGTDAGNDNQEVYGSGGPDSAGDSGEENPDAGNDPQYTGQDAAAQQDAGTTIPDCVLNDAGAPTELRCTGLYSDWAHKTVATNVSPFDPGFHLWSDGAEKSRWVYLPPATQVDTSNMDEWKFNAGTKFWKEFVLGGKRIETRLLWKATDTAWYRTTYRWSADESSATELTSGEKNADGNGFEIPSQAQCAECHNGRKDNVLGFEAVGLSSPHASGLTLAALVEQKLITSPPIQPITVPGNANDTAVLGYLHANCGNACHNRDNGEAKYTGYFMRLDVATLTNVQSTDTWTTGMNVASDFNIPGIAAPNILTPCDPASSAVYYRMSHRDGLDGTPSGTQMPRIDTHKIDAAAVSMISNWLNTLPQCN